MISVLSVIAVTVVYFVLTVFVVRLVTSYRISKLKQKLGTRKQVIAFFHPFAEACGGGEKVLF